MMFNVLRSSLKNLNGLLGAIIEGFLLGSEQRYRRAEGGFPFSHVGEEVVNDLWSYRNGLAIANLHFLRIPKQRCPLLSLFSSK